MRINTLRLACALALARSASAHSWIEYASIIAPNGTMIGDLGYPRGYMPRNESGWKDAIPTLLLPVTGQAAYSGNEVMNKFPPDDKPKYPMLQAAPGDHIALIHFENGHVTLPQNQPNKPLNRGTIYFYGTSKPNEQEKLFDVHLRWNQNGTGGDKRGILLATRNYDDGQCFQPNTAEITNQRVSRLSSDGAKNTQELPCQSDLKLPDDLKPGSVYTIYWYWDWPTLNPQKIDMQKTKNGSYPWAGSFMRRDPVPNGWTMDCIGHNESYASVIDIKITGKPQQSQAYAAKDVAEDKPAAAWVSGQNIYSKAVHDQMSNNYQVQVPNYASRGGGGGGDDGDAPANPPGNAVNTTQAAAVPAAVPAASPAVPIPPNNAPSFAAPANSTVAAAAPVAATSAQGADVVTVTQTVTVPPTTLQTTVYRRTSDEAPSPQQNDVVTVTATTWLPPPRSGPTPSSPPTVTPFL